MTADCQNCGTPLLSRKPCKVIFQRFISFHIKVLNMDTNISKKATFMNHEFGKLIKDLSTWKTHNSNLTHKCND